MGEHVLFFYGTLMAPQILHRVIHGSPNPEPWQKALLTFQPAILHNYTRHRVRGADYPGIIAESPAKPNETGNGNDSTAAPQAEKKEPAAVLGTLVLGLTDGDIHRLDIFEGSEYIRQKVKVRMLQETRALQGSKPPRESGADAIADAHLKVVLAAGSEYADEGSEVEAVTYVYVAGRDRLEDAEWDFETFKRDKMAWWIGADEREW